MQKETYNHHISAIKGFYQQNRRLPTQREICTLCGFSSRNQAFRLVQKMTRDDLLKKDSVGRIAPRLLFGVPFLEQGVQAGPNTLLADDELRGYVSLDEMMVMNLREPIMVEVSGDSMEGEGIYDGSLIIGERSNTFNNGDVVIIEFEGGGRSVKYFRKDPRGKIRFESANPRYKPLYPSEQEGVLVIGKVKWVINKK